MRICQDLTEHAKRYINDFEILENERDYDTFLYCKLLSMLPKFLDDDRRQSAQINPNPTHKDEFKEHMRTVLINFKLIERRIILLKIAEKRHHPLYKGFCMYEQLKIFMNMNLDYIIQIFSKPLTTYKAYLEELQGKMIADDEDEDAGLIFENVQNIAGSNA